MKQPYTPYQKLALTIVCLVVAGISLDYYGFPIALPVIGDELGASTAQIGWIMNANQLSFAATVVGLGRIADMIGRVRIMILGSIMFAVGAAVSIMADGFMILAIGRAIIGIASAMISVASLSVLSGIFDAGPRKSAIGILSAAGLGAGIIGPFVAGFLAQEVSWRWFFLVDLGLAAASVALLIVVLKEPIQNKLKERFDFIGFIGMAAAIVLLVYGLDAVDTRGWASPVVIASLALGVAFFVGFYFAERRIKAPLVDFSLFEARDFTGSCLVVFLTQLPIGATVLFLTLYLQHVLGYSPILTGVIFLAYMIPGTISSIYSGQVMDRMGARMTMTLSTSLCVLAFVCFGFSKPQTGIELILAGLLLVGLGQAVSYAAASTIAIGAVPTEKSGQASGVLKAVAGLGGSIGIASGGAMLRTAENIRLNRMFELAGGVMTDAQQETIRSLLSGSDAAREKLAEFAPDIRERLDVVVNVSYSHAFRDVMFFFIAISAAAFLAVFIISQDGQPEKD